MSGPFRYDPDYAVTPGEVLEELLSSIGMTKAELAARCGRPTKTLSEIIHGKAAITPETALQLERVLGRPASLWQNLEVNYRLRLARQQEAEELGRHAGWARSFPVKELVGQGCIEAPTDDSDLVAKLLAFFGVGTHAGWEATFGETQVAYRRSPSFRAAPRSVSAWIRRGELEAAKLECAPYSAKRFRAALVAARALAAGSLIDVWGEVAALAAGAGVAVVLVPELPKTHLSGVARWLSKDKALIQLSMRHKRGDHVWFSLFHEAGHILLHGKKSVFVDEKGGDHAALEAEADTFAQDLLLAPAAYAAFVARGDFTTEAIQRFARAQAIHAGVVVGRLQREGRIPYSAQAALFERLAWE